MKTIKEAAKKYARRIWAGGKREFGSVQKHSAQDFIAGAEYIREQLTRWNDPKEIMPEPGKKVLVKCVSGEIQTDFYEPELGVFFIEHATYAKVIGWREMM